MGTAHDGLRDRLSQGKIDNLRLIRSNISASLQVGNYSEYPVLTRGAPYNSLSLERPAGMLEFSPMGGSEMVDFLCLRLSTRRDILAT